MDPLVRFGWIMTGFFAGVGITCLTMGLVLTLALGWVVE